MKPFPTKNWETEEEHRGDGAWKTLVVRLLRGDELPLELIKKNSMVEIFSSLRSNSQGLRH